MQNKQLWALIVGMGLVSGGALAQQPPRQESPEVTAAEMEAMKEAAAAGGTGSVDGFGETYGEQVEREQDAIEATPFWHRCLRTARLTTAALPTPFSLPAAPGLIKKAKPAPKKPRKSMKTSL